MDMRIEKTRRSIINAFLQLRAQKPLEKITVKELSALAEINKATFYLHYRDIYELSESLEREVVRSVLHGIEHPENILTDNKQFIRELTTSFVAERAAYENSFRGQPQRKFPVTFRGGTYRCYTECSA